MNMSVREFIRENQRGLPPDQTCYIRICDLDEHEHLSFILRQNTDLNRFNNVYDQDMLDSDVVYVNDWNDEEGRTLFITANIEL